MLHVHEIIERKSDFDRMLLHVHVSTIRLLENQYTLTRVHG